MKNPGCRSVHTLERPPNMDNYRESFRGDKKRPSLMDLVRGRKQTIVQESFETFKVGFDTSVDTVGTLIALRNGIGDDGVVVAPPAASPTLINLGEKPSDSLPELGKTIKVFARICKICDFRPISAALPPEIAVGF